jgi:cytochrome c oxidase subunit 2
MKARIITSIIGASICWALMAAAAVAQPARPVKPEDVGFDQRLDEQVPLELAFRDEGGKTVRLGEYFHGKPVVLALVYYECPMLCNQVLNGLAGSLKALSFDAGKEFEVVAVSFNPRESSALAAAKKETYVHDYGRVGAAQGWHFLTGDPKPIEALAQAVGFRYVYDPMLNQYAHASGVVVLTPQGRVARYFYGIEYAPRDLRFGLIEAAQERIGTPVDRVLLLCYRYDPRTGKYGAAVMNSLRLGGVATLVGLAGLLFALNRRTKNARRRAATANACRVASLIPFMPEKASSFAGDVDALYYVLVGLSVFFGVLIAGLEIYFAVRYRRRSPGEIPPKTVPSYTLEVAWIAIPFLICVGIFLWGASLFYTLYSAPKSGPDVMDVYVTGKQWMWRFQHAGGQREINELHVPVGARVKLTMSSEDVVHSFFVPAFRVKADVVPGQGRYTTVWFNATKPGRYHIFCAEYCGMNHSGMGGWVEAMRPEAYQAWLSGGAAEGSLASSGQKLFEQLACSSCHKTDGTGRCPVLTGVFGKQVDLQDGRKVTADESYIRESILSPTAKIVAGYQPIMPNFTGQVSEEQISQLIAYIKSIGPPGQGAANSSQGGQGAKGTITTGAPGQQRSNPIGSTPPRGTR